MKITAIYLTIVVTVGLFGAWAAWDKQANQNCAAKILAIVPSADLQKVKELCK